MKLTTRLALGAAALVPLASAFTFTIGVGKDEVTGNVVGLGFDPSRIAIPATDTDDEIVFQMLGGTHQVAQVSFTYPCTPLQGGYLQPEPVTAPNGTDAPGVQQFTFPVTENSGPLYFSDIANNNCARGAVFCVNTDESSAESCAEFKANALAQSPAVDTLPASVFPGSTSSDSGSASSSTAASASTSSASVSSSPASTSAANTASGSAPTQSTQPTSGASRLDLSAIGALAAAALVAVVAF
ncbi:hypothetical protein OIV83_001123 [Microbotryomycetes sp. JL201]|nr:hypothetical protein OIV83_001123 [Microbotryomycetes sp. JL201]